jgi:hypothetical protein
MIGRCVQRHRRQEFIRFLNVIGASVPAGKLIYATADNYATHQHPKGAAVARSTSALDIPLHANLCLVAQRGRGFFCQAD